VPRTSPNLSSGNAWGTTVEVANQRQLESDGIEISIGNAEGIPPYSGTLAIVSSSRSGYGTYNAIITVTGNDPSTSNAILGISVMPIITTTAAVTSVTTSLQSTAPTTIPPTTIAQRVSGAVSWTYFIAAVAAIIVILVLALILNRAGQTRRKKQPH
ncbi:MAG: hypothetical protein M1321_02865, partial [Candidatus Marsarchaeota archaeon]|nr:hypothetical protein [Candidatus Marsarchaeota archaeon]